MRQVDNKYKSLPFWSWNDELDPEECVRQVEWMHEVGIGGFFMHARGGLKTPYLGEKWFDCIDASSKKAKELNMEAYAYDENGWPSGFVGGLLLEDIENHDRCLKYKIGAYDKDAYVSYDLSGDKLVRTKSGDNCINVYMEYAPSTADILNPEVVDKFIEKTHEEYKKRDTYDLKGFFTDEPQYFRWGHAYTKVLDQYFKDKYNEDIKDGLGLLFVEKEGYRAFRYKYWKCMQELMLKNFAEKIYNWCDKYGYKLTGHYVEEGSLSGQMMCCGGIMPFYEFEHIPGIDKLGRPVDTPIPARQLGSVAAQLGKEQTLVETFACAGWDVTPLELKKIAEAEYVYGVNLMCQHLLPYSEHGQRKKDYPSHFSKVNPWIEKNFKEFNDYFSVLGEILSKSTESPKVLYFQPIRSAYFTFKRELDWQQIGGCKDLNESYLKYANELSERQIPCHYLDETILARHGHVEGNKLVIGKCSYEYIVFPLVYTMDKTTEAMLKEFVANGGKVLLTEGKPEYLEGEEYSYDYLKTNTSWEEMEADRPFDAPRNSSVRLAHRVDHEGRDFIYAVALNGATDMEIKPHGYKSFEVYDILKDEYKVIDTKLHFEDGQSYVLYFSNKEAKAEKSLSSVKLGKEFKVTSPVNNNWLTLDFLQYSTDGVNYSEKLHHMGIFDILIRNHYQGDLYYKYTFNVKTVPSICEALIEDTNVKEVKINGKTIVKTGTYLEKDLWVYDVAKYLKEGENEIVVLLNWWQSDIVYFALLDDKATESIKNCLSYDTDCEAIYLRGNFGVYGEFEQGKSEEIFLGKNFYLDTQKDIVTDLIHDGYPFFSGTINLSQTIKVDSTEKCLEVDKRFHLLGVKVNGDDYGQMMFSQKLNVSPSLKVGENQVELELTVGRRNTLGPFHTPGQEDFGVGPYSWERPKQWVNGKCSSLRESYSFVKTII